MILNNTCLSKENLRGILINIFNSHHNINNLKVDSLQQFLNLNMLMKHIQMAKDMLEKRKME